MRKLKLQVQMSIDGYIAGPAGEMDWMQWNWDDDLNNYVKELTNNVDCIVLGRKLAEGFIPYWASNPDEQGAAEINSLKKEVFTKTLKMSPWENTVLAKGDLTEEINSLKNQDGKDIIAYGGSEFVSALIKHHLIDEYHLLINPTVIGNGMPIFKEVETKLNLKLINSRPFNCGIVVLHYKPE